MGNVYILGPEKLGRINPNIYGHFTEQIGGVFYDGLWVGEKSSVPDIHGFRRELIEKLRRIHPPVIRWPGGCFAEIYNWRDGIGKREDRPVRMSWWTQYDGRYEDNAVGTGEFMELCRLTGAKPYLAANLTGVSPLAVREWMDYCNSPAGTTALAAEREKNGDKEPYAVPYWGIGNENWGGGGAMTPEYYAMEYRRYSTLCSNAFPQAELFACGPNGEDYEWTRKFFDAFRTAPPSQQSLNGFSLHYYCFSHDDPLAFGREDWLRMLWQANHMDEIINRHWGIIKGFQMEEKGQLVVDEWGCWHPEGSGPSKGYNLYEQQSTMRDAMVSAVTLNIFNNNCDKVKMANVAQLVNNLHCLFLAQGNKLVATPTYYVYDLFQEHQGAQSVRCIHDMGELNAHTPGGQEVKIPRLSVSASVKNGQMLVTLGNLSPDDAAEITLMPVGFRFAGTGVQTSLFCDDLCACNTFEQSERIVPHSEVFRPECPIVIPRGGIAGIRIPLE